MKTHAPETPVPVEALTDPDFEAHFLPWAPLAETGVSLPCGACQDVCTCEESDEE